MGSTSAYIKHGELTSLGRHSSAVESISSRVESVVESVRGLFLHVDSLKLYGLDEMEFTQQPRTTLPASARLDNVLEKSKAPLSEARPYELRELGTCRDYALMTCSMLRQKQIAARVGCGFARYFSPGKYEDHWICEYWKMAEHRWARADAQLDAKHCHHLEISFNTFDLPVGAFLTAKEAWDQVRRSESPADSFGHGKDVGEWFIWVNLARDLLSLLGQETSVWDTWRNAAKQPPKMTEVDRLQCDALASAIATVEVNRNASVPMPKPFWVAGP